jgi:hypothetical protein
MNRRQEESMSLTDAIEAFNQSSQPQITLQTSRDGRVTAHLPRVGREVLVEGSQFNQEVKVTAADGLPDRRIIDETSAF